MEVTTPLHRSHFPDQFVFGAATASYQVRRRSLLRCSAFSLLIVFSFKFCFVRMSNELCFLSHFPLCSRRRIRSEDVLVSANSDDAFCVFFVVVREILFLENVVISSVFGCGLRWKVRTMREVGIWSSGILSAERQFVFVSLFLLPISLLMTFLD